MKRRLAFGILGLALVAGSAIGARAEGTSCGNETPIVPDGSITESFIPASTTYLYIATTVAGSSYSVQFKSTVAPASGGGTLTVVGGDCTTPYPGVVDRTGTAPREPYTTERFSFTATGTQVRFRFVSGATGEGYSFSVSETSLYNPAWSTGGSNETFYAFLNTTNTALNGSLTLTTSTGTVFGPFAMSLPAGRTTPNNTLDLGIPDSLAGSAKFTHDGPPGAILAQATIANFSTVPAYNQVVKFEPVRQDR